MRRIAFVVVAANLAIWTAGPAEAATVSLIGAWQSCKADRCSERFAFQPNGTVIKQYVVLGSTVTAHGRYKRRGDVLKITWTRFSPKQVCPPTNPAGQSSCRSSAEPPAQGPIRFKGFNALVWKVSSQPLRLVRIEE
ncbi:MAG: hypothetical protein WA813_14785 [Beijerinckiaceae bacterium]